MNTATLPPHSRPFPALPAPAVTAAAYQRASYRAAPSPRRRASSITLAVAVVALILLMLIRLGVPGLLTRAPAERTTTFSLSPSAAPQSTRSASAKKAARPASAAPVAPALPKPIVPPKPEQPRQPTPQQNAQPWPEMLKLTRDEMASADLSHMPAHADEGAGGGTSGKGSADAGDSVADYGPGEGPNGERLFNADWYREPTNAELAGYMPPGGAPPGWALIACRTAPQYHVENCRELGESPLGSGLARALRQAAWQFRVLPPRKGGKALIGAWVRIRFDFSVKKAG